ncbi:MAG: hypothetical protein DBX45_07290 [Oscillospiraceae bacterium]|jgi:hypothetical protein|nr:MAG: hypothetical protein DBX45_07290 [Oscillospiraceae bacterium]
MSRFDRYTWRPEICNTAKDIYRILTSLDTKNKKIKRIVPIGMAENMKRDGYEWKYREILLGIGMTNEQLQSYPYAAQVLFPCELQLCEPVVILFDDGSTLEMKPNGGSALLVAANQISPDTVCGTNEPNFDPNILFDSLRGCSIEDIRILRNVAVDSCGHSDYEEKTELITFELVLSGDRGLFFRQSWDDWFTFGTTDSRWCRRGKINISSIPYALIEQAAYNNKDITIIEGRDSGGTFWITPTNIYDSESEEPVISDGISIDEDDISGFLYYFLDKYFDKDLPYIDLREEYESDGFEWHLACNLYTYDTMNKMLDDIDECAELLDNAFDDPRLDELKGRLDYYRLCPDDDWYNRAYTKAEMMDFIRSGIGVVTNFYRRFSRRMRGMMEHSPDCDAISFTGP